MLNNPVLIRTVKITVTVLTVAWIAYTPTYYAEEINAGSMTAHYSWLFSFLTLYTIWTRKPRYILKAIASLGPVMTLLLTLFMLTGPHVGGAVGHILVAVIVTVSVLTMAAIWLRRPETAHTVEGVEKLLPRKEERSSEDA